MIGDSQSLPRLVGVALVVLVGLDKTCNSSAVVLTMPEPAEVARIGFEAVYRRGKKCGERGK